MVILNGVDWVSRRSNKTHWTAKSKFYHFIDVMMRAMASQITSLTIVYSTVYSRHSQTKHQSSVSLAFVRGIHRRPVNSPHKWSVMRKYFHFMTSSWFYVIKIRFGFCWFHEHRSRDKQLPDEWIREQNLNELIDWLTVPLLSKFNVMEILCIVTQFSNYSIIHKQYI